MLFVYKGFIYRKICIIQCFVSIFIGGNRDSSQYHEILGNFRQIRPLVAIIRQLEHAKRSVSICWFRSRKPRFIIIIHFSPSVYQGLRSHLVSSGIEHIQIAIFPVNFRRILAVRESLSAENKNVYKYKPTPIFGQKELEIYKSVNT